MLPRRCKYLSGFIALNIPNENGVTADWHPHLHLREPLIFFSTADNPILCSLGIQKRFVPMLKCHYFVANFARAIADLVYIQKIDGLKNCAFDFLDKNDLLELFGYLELLLKGENDEGRRIFIEKFLKYELTKLYFEVKNA